MSANFRRIADAAVKDAGRRLREPTTSDARVGSVFWYGAVEIDPGHLVVWVLLTGRPDDELPAWHFPNQGVTTDNARLGAALLSWIDGLRQIVIERFAVAGWPDPATMDVGFDSLHRVETNGGWHYFK